MASAGHADAAASFDPLRPKLMRVAYRMLGSVADVEDVIQEAFIRWMKGQTRSYGAFSYQDIADALGIRKASIHYHFASKAELGAAVADRYTRRFATALAALDRDQSKSSMAMLDFYLEP